MKMTALESRKRQVLKIILTCERSGSDYDRPYEASLQGVMDTIGVKRTSMNYCIQELVNEDMITFQQFHVRTKDGKIHQKSRFPMLTRKGREYTQRILREEA